MTSVRLAHSRFFHGQVAFEKDIFDKIVTTAWSYEPETQILTYGATVYKKVNKNDFWNKRQHKDQALSRFMETPLRIKLVADGRVPELNSSAIDWFIGAHLIYKFGVCDRVNPDVRRVHHETNIRPDFNEFYDPSYSPKYIIGGPRKMLDCDDDGISFPLLVATFGILGSLSLLYLQQC